jgi:hypothetical protein
MCELLRILPANRTFSETEELCHLITSKEGHELKFFSCLPRSIIEPLLRHVRYQKLKTGQVVCQPGNLVKATPGLG